MNSFITKSLTHIAVLLAFLVLSAIYFYPQLEGKVLPQGDIMQYMGMSQEVRAFKEKTGKTALWTNAMFGGMPTYKINTIRDGNTLRWADKLGRLGIKEPIGNFFVAMTGFYILLACLGVNPWLSAIGALAFGFTTNNLILYEAGHASKLNAIAYLSFMAAGIMMAFRKQYLWGSLLFGLGLGLSLLSDHVQMTYYFFITLLIFGLAQLVDSILKKEITHFAKATAMLVLSGLVAIASAASNLLPTYEYAQDTMRGKPILEKDANTDETSSSAVEGLSWDYAMQWSNNTLDLFAAFIPGVVGGGSQEPLWKNSAIREDLSNRGARLPEDFKAPLYWGALPFTSGPAYFGATVVLFFLMGLILVKGAAKWWLAIGTLLTFLLSMGKNLEWFNELFFNYFPLYNKFRTPNSVLSVTALLVPMLGFLALGEILKSNSNKRLIMISLAIGGGIALTVSLFFAILGPSMFSFAGLRDTDLERAGYNLSAVIADRQALMRGDAFRAFLLVALSGGLVWAFVNKKIQKSVLIIGLGILVIFDVWTVGRRYLDSNSFVSKTTQNVNFKPRPVDEVILKDQDPNFRVLDLSVSTFEAAFPTSYFHKSLGGYNAAKLQRYQDIIDRHLLKNNEKVVNMLNTKYYITRDTNGQPEVQINMGALGNAWFVSQTLIVNSANQEIDALTTFNPAEQAIIHSEFSNYLEGLNIKKDSTNSISLTKYEPNYLVYQSNAKSEQLAVFSEVWYGPDKGWQAYIDGKPVSHIRSNYILRALRIPAGQHSVEFKFEPQSYQTGKLLSAIFSSILLLGLLGFGGFSAYQSYQEALKAPKPEKRTPKEKTVPQKNKPKPQARKGKK